MLEQAISERAHVERLIDPEGIALWRAKAAHIPDARHSFYRALAEQVMRSPAVDGVKWDQPAVRDLVEHIFQQYAYAFGKKLAMGERYEQLHPGVAPIKNAGYALGATQVDIITSDAMSWLSHLPVTTANGYERMGDARAVPMLGAIVSSVVSAMTELKPQGDDLIDPYILRVEPQPRNLPVDQSTAEKLVDRIWKQPEAGAYWADENLRNALGELGKR
ncbi:MAG: hypothetical protein WDN72_05035 [Alphaproteobacteria bacterium]